jgi:hypothetical protein
MTCGKQRTPNENLQRVLLELNASVKKEISSIFEQWVGMTFEEN